MNSPFTAPNGEDYTPVIPMLEWSSHKPSTSNHDPDASDWERFYHGRFRVFTARQLESIPQIQRLSPEQRFSMKVVSSVLPFRVNRYVIDHLIDWDNVPNDPMFQLTFPQPGMLAPEHFERIADLLRRDASKIELDTAVSEIRDALKK